MNISHRFAIRFTALAVMVLLGGCLSSEDTETAIPDEPTAPGNSAPIISGTPSSSVLMGEQYSFTPSASDADNDRLTFDVQGEPSWLTINSGTGALTGTPTLADVGSHSGIVVSVSDGSASASLPQFSVDVVEPGAPSNSAPTISGTPSSTVLVDEQYSFTPSATDADDDPLTFDVQGEPNWLVINSGSGALTGTPTLANVGSYSGIVVSVSDGSASASLPQFGVDVVQNANGSITLSWTAPTQNEDGSAVDLAAYKFYYGTSPGNYSNQVRVNSPGMITYMLENLTPATYYVVATAISTSGAESAFSNEASKQVL